MRLTEFISRNGDSIVKRWEGEIRKTIAESPNWVLRDHALAILSFLSTRLLESPCLTVEQERTADSKNESVTIQHVLLAIESGLDLAQVIGEFQALRNCVIELWRSLDPAGFRDGADEIADFCAVLDENVRDALLYYKDRETRYRDRFLRIVGHELRNPINSIVLGATALSSQDLSPAASATVARVLTSARRLTGMLGDFLEFSRGRLKIAMPIVPVATDLRILVNEAIDEVTLTYPESRIELAFEGHLNGRWDPNRVRQLISNLILNAIQHGSGDRIEVEAKGDKTVVSITIHNQGPAIPDETLAGLFDPLVTCTRDHRPGTGLGLGLFVVKQIVTSHWGSITVSSTDGSGTTFTVTLPRHVDGD
jgi:signal transduction histidine kinase